MRLFERPRHHLVVPGYRVPVLFLVEAGGRLLPGLADFLVAHHARQERRDS